MAPDLGLSVVHDLRLYGQILLRSSDLGGIKLLVPHIPGGGATALNRAAGASALPLLDISILHNNNINK